MRKLALLVVVALVATLSAPAMAKQIFTQKHLLDEIGASFGDTGDAWFSKGIVWEEFGLDIDDSRECPGGDPAWVSIHGGGMVNDLTVSPTNGKNKLTLGEASGTFHWGDYDWQRCSGASDSGDLGGKGITIYMDGTGGLLVKEREVNDTYDPDGTRHRMTETTLKRFAIGDVRVKGVWSREGVPGWIVQKTSTHRVK